jgi:hypothetical protein
MKAESDPADSRKWRMQRQLLVRLGRVEEVFPERHFMLKGIQTNIAIFGGQPSYDRSQSGHSMGSLLNAKIRILDEENQVLEFAVSNIGLRK